MIIITKVKVTCYTQSPGCDLETIPWIGLLLLAVMVTVIVGELVGTVEFCSREPTRNKIWRTLIQDHFYPKAMS